MEFIEPILNIASAIYKLADKVKANKKLCHSLADRVKDIEFQVKLMRDKNTKGVEKALCELKTTLESARDLIKKYTEDEKSLIKRILKLKSHEDDLLAVRNRLTETSRTLLMAMMVEHKDMQVELKDMLHEVLEKIDMQKQDEADRQEDEDEIEKLLKKHLKKEEDRVEELKRDVDKKLDMMKKPSAAGEERRLIKPEELTYSKVPPKPFMVSSSSEVYKGEYHGFTVAIKRFINQPNISLSEVKAVFYKEADTMRDFESPNILRVFGICVKNEEGPRPEYLIIMEYCEKRSLREVLDSDCELSWTRKARMCLDAAQGLYRLHQTEDKSKVHGYISSGNIFVDEGYRVKLGGFELAQTETSLKRGRNYNKVRSLCYLSPQILSSIDEPYTKECDVYSLGIVMWEIATRQHPFEDPVTKNKWEKREILQRVCEPLPEDCPKGLGDLINACRAYESFSRPSAGVLMDKLRIVVAQLE